MSLYSRSTLLLLCLLLHIAGLAQPAIWGRLRDEATGEPVAGASIYSNNSQVRMSSDSNGLFRIPARYRGSTLLVTHLAYEKTEVTISGSDTLRAALRRRNEELGSVVVKAKARDSWKKWGAVFTEYFIGTGDAGRRCRLLNPEALVFNYNEANGLLSVRARAPLQLENRLIGYRVHLDLDYFRFFFNDGHFVYSASSYYEPLTPADEQEALSFAAQRLLAYGGSRQHFVRALYEGRLAAEGFHLYGFRARPNEERSRIEGLLLRERARQNSQARSTVSDNQLTGGSRDSSRYYARILAQPGYLFEDSLPLDLGARWKPLQTGAAFRIPDSLLLQYAPAAGIRDAARRLGRWGRWATSGNEAYTFLQSQDAQSQYALLYLQGDSLLRGNSEGVIYNNSALSTEGYLSQRRTAFTLPLDYAPGADEALLAGRKPDDNELRAARLDSLLAGIHRHNDVSRIYLHLDKSIYDRFENIWFSAFLLYSPVPRAAHRTLQVLLLQKEGRKIRARERFVLQEGRGAGNLFLPDSLPAGRYELIAYTDQQAREPGKPLFRQEILLRDPSNGYSQRSIAGDNELRHDSVFFVTRIYTDKKAYAEGLRVGFRLFAGSELLLEGKGQVASGGLLRLPGLPVARIGGRPLYLHCKIQDKLMAGELYTELSIPATPGLRWFPEGGDLVDSLPARLVFECRDAGGAPLAVKAVLYENDSPLALLQTSEDGFGWTELRPRRGRRYSVRNEAGGLLETSPFPPVLSSGLTLQVTKGVVSDSVDLRLYAKPALTAFVSLHDFRNSYASVRLLPDSAGVRFRIPLGGLPSGPATITVFDSSGTALAERTLLRRDTSAATVQVITDSILYDNRQRVRMRLRVRDSLGNPLAADLSIACVRAAQVDPERFQHIVPFARWQRYAALQHWPLQAPGYSLSSDEANERFLLTQCWTRYRWQSPVAAIPDSIQPAIVTWKGRVTYQGYPLRKAVDIVLQTSDTIRRVRTDSKGNFILTDDDVTVREDWPIEVFVDMPDKHLYNIELSLGDEERLTELAAEPSPGLLQTKMYLPDASEDGRYRTLATVVKQSQHKNSRNSGPLTPNSMGGCPDYVCIYGLLNCTNHLAGSTKPVILRKYWMKDVGLWLKLITYRGCGKYDSSPQPDSNSVLHAFRGRYYSKEFYVADYRQFNPAVPETSATLYWNPQLLTDDKGEATITFYSNDLEGTFQVLIEGMSARGPVQGGSIIRVEQSKPPGQ